MGIVPNLVEKNQPEVFKILKNSLVKGRLSHAYLFEGDKGVGKGETSLYLAKALFCSADSKPCGACNNCKRIDSEMHPDVFRVLPEGQSIKKVQILLLQEEFKKKSVEESSKVFIISDAEKMTMSASNSMLKFIEEPYPGTIVILITNYKNLIIPTIISRCQVISFKELDVGSFVERLAAEGVTSDRAKVLACFTKNLEMARELNDEWFGDAINVAFSFFMLRTSAIAGITSIQSDWMPKFDNRERIEIGLELLIIMYRDLLLVKHGKIEQVVNSRFITHYTKESSAISELKIAQNISHVLEAQKKLKSNVNNQLLMDQLAVALSK